LRCLSCAAAAVAVCASAAGVRTRGGRALGVAGLVLGVPAAALLLATDPALAGVGLGAVAVWSTVRYWN